MRRSAYRELLRELHLTVVVAVIAVRMVQVTVHQVVGVIAVGDSLVAAARTVLVSFLVTAAVMARCAGGRIGRTDRQRMLLDLAADRVVQVAVVQVIDMAIVLDGRVAAVGAVLVRVTLVMSRHSNVSLLGSMRCDRIQLGGVGQRVQNQIDDVSIR